MGTKLVKSIGFKTASKILNCSRFSIGEEYTDKLDIFFSSADKSMMEIFHVRSKRSKTIFVLTFDEHGSVAYYKRDVFECPAIQVKDVLDTTGFSDCYQAHSVSQ